MIKQDTRINIFTDRYRCECGKVKTKLNRGLKCDRCNTEVRHIRVICKEKGLDINTIENILYDICNVAFCDLENFNTNGYIDDMISNILTIRKDKQYMKK